MAGDERSTVVRADHVLRILTGMAWMNCFQDVIPGIFICGKRVLMANMSIR